MMTDMFRGYEAGGVDYLVKPYQPEVLLAKVRVFLELNRYHKELQRKTCSYTWSLNRIFRKFRSTRAASRKFC